jgi:RNA polymerase sigma-70 factor, ECF subfamily
VHPDTPPSRGLPSVIRWRSEDVELVRACLGGARWAPAVIVERYRPLVRRCLSASFDGADLDDQVQEAFARCFHALSRLRDPSALRSFLIGIALRLAAMERRRRGSRRWERLTETGDLPEDTASDEPIETRQVAVKTRALLERLQPASSWALELRYLHEQELTEVAESLGVSLATAKRHLARAQARVRALAEGEPVVAEFVRDLRRRPARAAAIRAAAI